MKLRLSLASLVVAASLAASPAFAYEPGEHEENAEPTAPEMAVDVVIVRPLGLVAMAVGSVFYIAAFPFAAMAGDIATPAERLVADPARYTFQRQLGRIYGPGETGSIHD